MKKSDNTLIKEIEKDLEKIESYSKLSFYKVIYINYKSGLSLGKNFDDGGKFVEAIRILNENKITFYPCI